MTNEINNYNTTLGKPFIRGQEILIKYGISYIRKTQKEVYPE